MEGIGQYLVTKRFRGKAICGDLNLPYGTKCFAIDGWICCDKGVVCGVESQNAYDFFTRDDDGCGEQRRKLIDCIFEALKRTNQSKESYDAKWDKIWGNSLCQKFKRSDYNDFWIWGYNFYHAEIPDLVYINDIITKGEKG